MNPQAWPNDFSPSVIGLPGHGAAEGIALAAVYGGRAAQARGSERSAGRPPVASACLGICKGKSISQRFGFGTKRQGWKRRRQAQRAFQGLAMGERDPGALQWTSFSQRFGFGTKRQGSKRRRQAQQRFEGLALGLKRKVGHVPGSSNLSRQDLEVGVDRGVRPRICHETCRPPLKFAQRKVNPRHKGKMVHGDPFHKRRPRALKAQEVQFLPGSLRHQGGRKGLIGQLARYQGGRKGSIGHKIRRPSKTGIRSASLCDESSWCLPGASQAVQIVLSCLPGASLVPRRLSN